MPEMDITNTEFDPTLDEPRWNVVVETATKKWHFRQVGKKQRDLLFELTLHRDYDYATDDGCHEFIDGKAVQYVNITKGVTMRQVIKSREQSQYRRY